jgi:hypothetical protein
MPQTSEPGKASEPATPLAYSIDDLPYGRTFAYQLIKDGKLKAKKSGRRTIITPDAWAEHLSSLPEVQLGEVA